MKIIKNGVFGLFVFGIAVLVLRAQQKPAPGKPETVVQEWFARWNALDGSDASVQKLLDLYEPNAMHEVGPNTKQIGPVFLEAPEGIKKMAQDFGKANTEITFRMETVTASEKSVQLYYVTDGPWGGPAVGVQFVGAYTVRETKKRYMYPGAAFFHIKDGKILYARIYSSRDQVAEVRQ
jgi:ketosteroid isomerase-like protein